MCGHFVRTKQKMINKIIIFLFSNTELYSLYGAPNKHGTYSIYNMSANSNYSPMILEIRWYAYLEIKREKKNFINFHIDFVDNCFCLTWAFVRRCESLRPTNGKSFFSEFQTTRYEVMSLWWFFWCQCTTIPAIKCSYQYVSHVSNGM